MRPPLRYALGATLVLAALAQWWPQAAVPLVPAAQRAQQLELAVAHGNDGAPPLPPSLSAVVLESAQRDPFMPWVPPAAPPPKPAVAPAPVPVQQPPPMPPVAPAPTAPTQSLRYLGYMQTPGGAMLVLLADGDMPVPVQQGTRLPNGYLVQAMGQNAVRLIYPPTGTLVDVPIPVVAPQRP